MKVKLILEEKQEFLRLDKILKKHFNSGKFEVNFDEFP